ncbi:MAG: hypothetical protein WDO56_26150 [Gammaproteobacteria bacterium]
MLYVILNWLVGFIPASAVAVVAFVGVLTAEVWGGIKLLASDSRSSICRLNCGPEQRSSLSVATWGTSP